MNLIKRYNSFFPLVLLGAFVSILFLFLGAPILRVIHNVYGRLAFWLSGLFFFILLSGIGASQLAFILLPTWLVVGFYDEIEFLGKASYWSALLAILGATLVYCGAIIVWPSIAGVDIVDQFKDSMVIAMQKYQLADSSSQILKTEDFNKDSILKQLPGVFFVVNMMSLAFALILDKRIARTFNLKYEKIASGLKLLDFKNPDFMIWITMLSLLGSFLNLNNENLTFVASTLLVIFLGLYFLQGLAVLESAMIFFRAGFFLRLFVYVFIVGQLFILLSILGIVDYWVDFRDRMKKFITKEKHKNGEHI